MGKPIEMLQDPLPADRKFARELRRRFGAALRKSGQQPPPGRIRQGSKHLVFAHNHRSLDVK
jgi:hypothetical protein